MRFRMLSSTSPKLLNYCDEFGLRLGQPTNTSARMRRVRKEINDTIRDAVTASGGKITSEEAGLIATKKEHKALKEQLTNQIPDLQDGDSPEVVNQKIDAYYDSLRTDLQKHKKGWFSDELTPEAQQQLQGLDAQKAATKASAQKAFQLGQANREVQTRLESERAQRLLLQDYLARMRPRRSTNWASSLLCRPRATNRNTPRSRTIRRAWSRARYGSNSASWSRGNEVPAGIGYQEVVRC